MAKRKITETDGWLIDGRNNRCSSSYWGSREAAEKALLSNKNCRDCIDCSDCSRCSRCYDVKNVNGEPINVPVIPSIHKAVFAAVTVEGALNMGSWHQGGFCGTTHCRAGWVTHLAGKEGKALEERFNTELAAMLIYRASGYEINPGRFYDTNAEALADMKACAEREAALATFRDQGGR